jgi:HK97 family phage major capsid protein
MSIAERKKELRSRAADLKTQLDTVFEAGYKKLDGGKSTMDAKAAAEFKKLSDEARAITEELNGFKIYDGLGNLTDTDAMAAKSLLSTGGQGIHVPQALMSSKSIGQRFLESSQFKGRQASGNTQPFTVGEDILDAEKKDIFTATGGTLTNFAFGQVEREPMVQRPYRSGRVRDLFPVASTNANLIEYLRVLGYLDGQNNAGMVPERETDNSNFGLKPHTSLSFLPAQAPVRTIAHWEVAHRNTLDDEPQLQSIIDTELLYGLRLMEDAQLLNGDGTGENILGILRTPGIQDYPGIPSGTTGSPVQPKDTYVDAIRRAATRIMLAYYEPTGVVVHPFDWERMETVKDANGNYIVAVNVSIGAESRIWRMPVVASPAITEGTALVGAFGLGAKVYDRQQANIRIAEQHGDLFVRNAVVVLAEERLALTVSRPESFVKVDLTTSTSA